MMAKKIKNNDKKRIAILHDYFDEIGGAEITALHMARELGATIYTTNIDLPSIKEMGFEDIKIKSIGRVPNFIPFKQYLTRFRFYKTKLEHYDIYIFTGTYSLQGAKNHKPSIWYVNSYLKDLYINKGIFQPLRFLWRRMDFNSVQEVDKIFSNSNYTQDEIKRIYNKESIIIYPFIKIKDYINKNPKNYWLCITRIDKIKNIEILLSAFKRLPDERLIVVGSSSKSNNRYLKELLRKKPENVSFLGEIYDKKKIVDLLANCKGLVTASCNESFGLNTLEAMASGKPVIAPNTGGYKETIIHEKTGYLIDDINEASLAKKIKKLSKELSDEKKILRYMKNCKKRAREFDFKFFIDALKQEVWENNQ